MVKIEKRLAQQLVETMKEVCGYDINYIDKKGIIFASTDKKRIGTFHEIGLQAFKTRKAIEVEKNDSYTGTMEGVNIPVSYKGSVLAVIGISGDPEEVRKYAHLSQRITLLFVKEHETSVISRNDSDRFNYMLQSLIHPENTDWESLLPILNSYGITSETPLRFLLLRFQPRYPTISNATIEEKILKAFRTYNIRIYSFHYPNEYYAVLNTTEYPRMIARLAAFAKTNADYLKIGVGKSCSIYQQSLSYETACIALQSIATKEISFANYDDLTIETLFYEVSPQIKREYLAKTILLVSEEDQKLLRAYYQNDMSLAHAAEKLFLHKNTLQYKLDRIGREIGYNPRKFRDAAILYLALQILELP